MRKLFPDAYAVAAIAAVSLLTQPAIAADKPEVLGAAVAKRDCIQCHAIAPNEYSRNGDAPPFSRLPKKFVMEELDAGALYSLMQHHAGMPEFRLSEDELRGLVAYIKSIQVYKTTSNGEERPSLSPTADADLRGRLQ